MNILSYTQLQNPAPIQKNSVGSSAMHKAAANTPNRSAAASYTSYLSDRAEEEKARQARELREQLRNMKRSSLQDANAASAQDRLKTLFEQQAAEAEKEKEEKPDKPVNYSSREVESKIRQAKNTTGAGRAVISAKRKVLELQRKMASGECDPEEVQLALTHAKRMEMVAKKKKHHLELEELVQITQKRDERFEQQEEAATELKDSMILAEEEKISEKQDAIFDERQKQIEEAMDEFEESGAEISDEMLADLNKMISEISEEEMKQLEEAMEMLENMEIIDPHMSEEDLKKLKIKHRASEEKALLKADMDYIKGMVRHHADAGAAMPGMGGGSPMGIAPGAAVSVSPSFNVMV